MSDQAVRIDKWLWAARFFKTRGLASEMAGGGHILINGDRAKASRSVKTGDTVSIQRDQELFIVTVTGLAEKRGSATIAQSLYQETEQSLAERSKQAQLRKLHAASAPAPEKRPDKKARRQIIRFIRSKD
ncbi:MAG: RNA-binding protein [Zetaproteobacteria bacterium CG12_big_fil_rev_8_21_14_0_65_54_13]|nr:MAG: RNA-binding protein [Zetaproteobacteria bacterium CG23_combo_of_CG06-09_8_20_14_all_54_7]PIW50946.1 MAG: RNA-binding protein [Zetaproteobacteria bacterium CG12_big_fil_rev_8_21_14_0_65_54_13]PIX54826.1 MAG: RNA-binding protein [Zetaproteobacteria bacterium CG_4_10_14_3_um_filter_54_28]PJA29520.1 MAG: RNA-binding protein [Zetaproteobacteria bacterium CG_4_9_14_3_um_filter_54_145]